MELVQDHVQLWDFGIDSGGHSGQFIRSFINYLFFQSVSKSVAICLHSIDPSVSENKTFVWKPKGRSHVGDLVADEKIIKHILEEQGMNEGSLELLLV
jgi:hypothetical protein